MKDIAIYGFGGFGREVACLIRKINEMTPMWNLIGFFDDGKELGEINKYGKVLGGINELNNYNAELSVIIAIANPFHIKKIAGEIINPNISFPNIIAPNVNFFDEETFTIGQGNIIFWGCRISCDVGIGDFNLMNGACSLGHDVNLGNFNVLGPSTRLSGNCMVGNENFFGVESVVLQGIRIGDKTKLGIGSVIIRNTANGNFYFGNPAKKIDGV
jgi:sugar O-acyltransferase (sialic acid O-acetyltransferase NeuD family)